MNINQDAPLYAREEVFINAPVVLVWKLQADIERWPQWQPDVASATLEGPLQKGTVFRWKAAGLNIVSTLQVVDEPRSIGWTGVSLGMRAAHQWHFEPRGEGTLAWTEESISGWLARLLKLFDRRFMQKSLAKSLNTLKAQAEQQASP